MSVALIFYDMRLFYFPQNLNFQNIFWNRIPSLGSKIKKAAEGIETDAVGTRSTTPCLRLRAGAAVPEGSASPSSHQSVRCPCPLLGSL